MVRKKDHQVQTGQCWTKTLLQNFRRVFVSSRQKAKVSPCEHPSAADIKIILPNDKVLS